MAKEKKERPSPKSLESETPEEIYPRYLNLFRKMISGIQLTPEETKELARYITIFYIYNIPHIEYRGKVLYLEPVTVYKFKNCLVDIKDLKFYVNPLTGEFYRIDMRSGKLKPTNKINLMRAVIDKLKLEKKMEREAEELERELKEEEEHKKKEELAFAGLEREEKKPEIIDFNELMRKRRQGTQPTPSGMEELAKLLDKLAYRITGEPLLESELDYEEEVLEEAQRRFNKLMRYIANKIQPFQLKEIMEQHKNDYNLVWFYWLLKEIFLSRTGLDMDKVRIVDVEGRNTWRKIISSAKRKFWEKIVNDSETGHDVLVAVDQLCREFGM